MLKKTFLIFLFLSTFLVFTYSLNKKNPEIEKALNFSKTLKNVDKIVVLEKNLIHLNGDGIFNEEIYQLSTALTPQGAKELAYAIFFFNSKYSKIKVNFARVIRKNGEIVEIPSEYIKSQPIGNKEDGFIQFYVKFPELKPGDSVEYSITLDSKSTIEKNYSEIFPFKYKSPIYHKIVKIFVPKNMKLFYKWRNSSCISKKEKTGNGFNYTFEVYKSPPLKLESRYFPIFDVAPTLYVSTIQRWKELSKIGYEESINSIDFNDDMDKKLKDLTAGKKTIIDKIFAVYHYITDNISFNQYSFNTGSFLKPKKASVVFKEKHGICREKSILLMAFLKKLGLNPVECLINLNSKTFPYFPTIYFDHSVVKITLKNGKTIFLDPLSSPATYKESTLVGDRYILPLTKKGSDLVKIPHISSDKNQLSLLADTVYRIDGILKSSITIETYGVYDTFYRSILKKVGTFRIGAFFNNLVKYIHPDANIPIPPDYVNYNDYKTNEAILLGIEVKKYPVELKNFYLFKPILLNGIFDPYFTGILNKYSKVEKISHPIYLISPISIKINEKFTLPNSDFKFITYPDDVNFKDKNLNFSLKFKTKKNSLIYNLKLNVENFTITPEEFINFKNVCNSLVKLKDAIILVKYTPKPKSGRKNEKK